MPKQPMPPVDPASADLDAGPDTQADAAAVDASQPDAAVIEVMMVLYRNLLRRKGLTPDAARRQLLNTEPFDLYPRLVESLPDSVD